ncbi:AraC family transcriptional regulator [Leptothrix discophora]|uniref:AraC family transcriptional regulator n=1 Tax=Leptothrix discophora TaxID=89 RepID=A0ABT9G296_LEPDI|nr:AraC family transcriptional regulator [Leptothrix discophora]MDP4300610.1 AraC family transcriptional regulator [Leptothrix discophora]
MRKTRTDGDRTGGWADGLAAAIGRIAQSDGDFPTAIPALSLHRRHRPTQPLHCIFNLGLGVVAQGHKQALLDGEVLTYGPGESMLTTIDLPVVSRVTQASLQRPLLGLMLQLDPRRVQEIAADMTLPAPDRAHACRTLAVEPLDASLMDALTRLVSLLGESPVLIEKLAPLTRDEVIVRLLVGPHRPQLLHLVADGAPSQQIATAVRWLKQNFARPLQVDELAGRVHMSPTTFRHHFRKMTGTSPLQYQKSLRLQEARQLMLTQHLDAGRAGERVGYESPSQFSREYSRLFGAPPQADVRRLRVACGLEGGSLPSA